MCLYVQECVMYICVHVYTKIVCVCVYHFKTKLVFKQNNYKKTDGSNGK